MRLRECIDSLGTPQVTSTPVVGAFNPVCIELGARPNLPMDWFVQTGLDVEWKPSGCSPGSSFSPASILQVPVTAYPWTGGSRACLTVAVGFPLQIASRTAVYVVDLIELCSSDETSRGLDQVLGQMFQASDIIKLGLAFQSDLSLLVKSYPQMR